MAQRTTTCHHNLNQTEVDNGTKNNHRSSQHESDIGGQWHKEQPPVITTRIRQRWTMAQTIVNRAPHSQQFTIVYQLWQMAKKDLTGRRLSTRHQKQGFTGRWLNTKCQPNHQHLFLSGKNQMSITVIQHYFSSVIHTVIQGHLTHTVIHTVTHCQLTHTVTQGQLLTSFL